MPAKHDQIKSCWYWQEDRYCNTVKSYWEFSPETKEGIIWPFYFPHSVLWISSKTGRSPLITPAMRGPRIISSFLLPPISNQTKGLLHHENCIYIIFRANLYWTLHTVLYSLFFTCWNISRILYTGHNISFAPILVHLLNFGFKNLYAGFSKLSMPWEYV